METPARPEPLPDQAPTGAGREFRWAGIAALVWAILLGFYALGFWGLVGGGPARPLVLLEAILFAIALLMPPVLFAALAALVANLRRPPPPAPEPFNPILASADLSHALIEAYRQVGSAERQEVRAALARIELRTAGIAREDEARGADRQAAQAEREEIRAALARMEEQAARAIEERARWQREAEAAAAERNEIRQALIRFDETAIARIADPGEAQSARDEIRAALARMEAGARRSAEERAALIALAEALSRERQEIRAALGRMEARADSAAEAQDAALKGRDAILAALARMEATAASLAEERKRLIADAEEAAAEREDIRAALARMEARAPDGEALIAERSAAMQEREEIRAALARLEERAARRLDEEALRQSELVGAAAEREAIREALGRMERARLGEEAGATDGDPQLEIERAEIQASLARMEERAAALAAERDRAAAERAEARRELAAIRETLARMEERAAAAAEARELLMAEREAAAREREEIRAALLRLEIAASAAAEDSELLGTDREAAARERDGIRAALADLEARSLGTVAEERAALAATVARLEEGQLVAGEALAALLRQRRASRAEAVHPRTRAPRHPRESDPAQQALPLADPETPADAELDWSLMLRALAFPRDAEDLDGFRALREARGDRMLADCLQAAEDLLTLLSQDGLYMDDLVPAPVAAQHWIAFAQGSRGADARPLGAIDSEAALAAVRRRLRADAVFRDTALHFLRRFDPVLRRFAEGAPDAEIEALSDTRTGRAFMLLARAYGSFD